MRVSWPDFYAASTALPAAPRAGFPPLTPTFSPTRFYEEPEYVLLMPVEHLTVEEVLRIHERLVEDFVATEDPISPPGVRSDNLLASAVDRQHVALGNTLKYPTTHENAATLLYGLTSNHPFFNGNKRTALVAMLAHLDRNKSSLFQVTQRELFNMMTKIRWQALNA